MDTELLEDYERASFVPKCSKLLQAIVIVFHVAVIYRVLYLKEEGGVDIPRERGKTARVAIREKSAQEVTIMHNGLQEIIASHGQSVSRQKV
jgi:hypothetical protein